MNIELFESVPQEIKLEILINKLDFASPFALLDSIEALSSICQEFREVLSKIWTRRYILSRFFKSKIPIESPFQKQSITIPQEWRSWKKYFINKTKIFDEHLRLIIELETTPIILNDYLVDNSRNDDYIIYENLEPVIKYTLKKDLSWLRQGQLIQIDGDILNCLETSNYNGIWTLYRGEKIPYPGEWILFYRKGDISIFRLVNSSRCGTYYLSMRKYTVIWIYFVSERIIPYISNNFFHIPGDRVLDLYTCHGFRKSQILYTERGYLIYPQSSEL